MLNHCESYVSYAESSECNLFTALAPLNIISRFLGIQKYTCKDNRAVATTGWSKLYSSILFTCLTATFFQSIIKKVQNLMTCFNISLSVTENVANVLVCSVANISIVLSAFVISKQAMKLFSNVQFIDRQLRIPVECYEEMRLRIILALLLLMLYLGFVIVGDGIAWYNPDLTFLLFPMYISLFIMDQVILQYLVDVWIVIFRLRVLTAQLICCNHRDVPDHQGSCVDFSPQNMLFIKSWENINNIIKNNNFKSFDDTISRVAAVYDKLADNVDIINSMYGVQVLLTTASCITGIFMGINSLLFIEEFQLSDNRLATLFTVNWCLHFVFLLLFVVFFTETIKYENKRGIVCINKLILEGNMNDRQRARLFVLENQMKTRLLVLTACGLFPVDSSLVYTFVGTVTAYTVILIQMKN